MTAEVETKVSQDESSPKIFDFGDVKPAGRRGRKPALSFKADEIAGMFGMVNMSMILFGYQEYLLDQDEIKALSESWYNVLKHYPGAAKWLVEGDKLTCWVIALGTTGGVVFKRVNMYRSNHPAETRSETTEQTVQEPTANGTVSSDTIANAFIPE